MLKKIAAYLPSTVIPILTNFVLVFIYAGQMDPGEYGIYSVYLNSISILYAVCLSFLQSASFRFYSIEGMYRDEREYYSTYYLANIALGALLALLLFAVNLFLKFDWVVISVSVLVNALYQFDLNVYRLRDKTGGYTFARLSAAFGALAFIGACVVAMGRLSYVIPIYTFYGAYLFTVIAEFVRCAKYLSMRDFSTRLLVESLKFGMPMMGVTVMGLLISYSAQYAILFFLSETAVGFYSLGFRLSDTVISNITMIILTVMTPAVMAVYDKSGDRGPQNGSKMLSRLINLDIWTVLPCCALLAFYSGDIIRLLFPAYEGAEAIVDIVVLSAVLRSLSMITCKGLELARETGKMFRYLMISLVVNVGYILAFLPLYGINAAGHASILAYLVYNVLLVRESQKYVPIKFDWNFLVKVGATTAAVTVVALLLRTVWGIDSLIALVLQGIVCVGVYLAASTALKMHRQFKGLAI